RSAAPAPQHEVANWVVSQARAELDEHDARVAAIEAAGSSSSPASDLELLAGEPTATELSRSKEPSQVTGVSSSRGVVPLVRRSTRPLALLVAGVVLAASAFAALTHTARRQTSAALSAPDAESASSVLGSQAPTLPARAPQVGEGPPVLAGGAAPAPVDA